MTQLDLFPIAKSSQQDTHVNPSPLPGTVKAQKMTATSGIMQIVTCKSQNVGGHISLGLDKVLSDTEDYSTRTFIIPACGVDAPINETGSGLWLTPTATQTDEHPEVVKKRMEKYPNGTTVGSLTSQVKYAPPLWATPNTMDSLPAGISKASKEAKKGLRKRSSNLRDQVNEPAMWATPSAADSVGSTGGGQGKSLRTDVKMWSKTEKVSGQLNPTWVEWLMGYPRGWTELKD